MHTGRTASVHVPLQKNLAQVNERMRNYAAYCPGRVRVLTLKYKVCKDSGRFYRLWRGRLVAPHH